MKQSVTDFITPYPDRDDPEIQTKIYAKLEFRECVPDPDPALGEYRIDDLFYNTQVFFQRFISEWRFCLMISGPGSGKSRCYICFEQYQYDHRPGEIKNFYYIGGDAQQTDFKNQVSNVIKEQEKLYGPEYAHRGGSRKDRFITMTVDQLYKEITRRSKNDELKRDFGNCAFMIDELHQTKLNEKKDTSEIRERFLHYCALWRLTHVCPNAVYIFATATPITNDVRELIYHINLMPKTKQIDTKLSRKVFKTVEEETAEGDYVIPDPDWVKVNLGFIDKLDPDYLDHLQGRDCNGNPIEDDEEAVDYIAELDKLERQLEEILRGRIIYVREPSTGAVKDYKDSVEDKCAHKYILRLLMHKFQSDAYAKIITNADINKAKDEFMNVDTEDVAKDAKAGKSNALYQLPKQASVFVFPTLTRIMVRLKEEGDDDELPSRVKRKSKTLPARKTKNQPDSKKKKQKNDSSSEEEKIKVSPHVIKKPTVKDMEGRVGTKAMEGLIRWVDKELDTPFKTLKYKPAKGAKMKKLIVKEPWVHPQFARYLRNDTLLYESSAKMTDLIRKAEDMTSGVIMISEEFYQTDCLIIAGTLESRPYPVKPDEEDLFNWEGKKWEAFVADIPQKWRDEEGNIILPSAPRYIIYSSGVKGKIRKEALDLIAHPANVNGKYLKIIVITEVGGLGINIFNVSTVYFFIPKFTPADDKQTADRAFRATSHVELLKQERAKMRKRLGPDADVSKATVGVDVRYTVAVVAPETDEEINEKLRKDADSSDDGEFIEHQTPSIDQALYRWIYEKDFKFLKVMKMLYRIAVDAQINIRRNVRPGIDKPGSRECFYENTCVFEPFNTDTSVPEDHSTYHIYGTNKMKNNIIQHLERAFSFFSGYEIDTLIDQISSQSDYTAYEIFLTIKTIIEKGTVLMLDDYGFNQYLAEDRGIVYVTRAPGNTPEQSLKYYSDKLILNDKITLETYAIDNINVQDVKKKWSKDKYSDIELSNYFFAKLNAYTKVKIFEDVWLLGSKERSGLIWPDRVLEAAKHLYYKEGNIIIHEIELLYSKTTNYNAVDGLLKPSANLRIFKDGIWRHTNAKEKTFYSKKIAGQYDKKLERYYKKFINFGIIGVIIRPESIHIKKFTYDEETDTYQSSEGTKVLGIKPHVLIGMIYDVRGILGKKKYDAQTIRENKAIIKSAYPKMPKSTIDQMAKNNPDKLQYYATIIEAGRLSPMDLSYKLARELENAGAIFTIVGSTKYTIEKMFSAYE